MEVLPIAQKKNSLPSERSSLIKKKKSPHLSAFAKKSLGVFSLIVIVVVWITQAEVSQRLQGKDDFNKPYFIVCFNHVLMGIMLPMQMAWYYFVQRKRDDTPKLGFFEYLAEFYDLKIVALTKISFKFALLMTLTDYCWYLALVHTSVEAATSIVNSSCVYVYILSVFVLHEKFQWKKAMVVIMTVFGVALLTFFPGSHHAADSSSNRTSNVAANSIILLSAIFFAIYQVQFKKDLGPLADNPLVVDVVAGALGIASIAFMIVGCSLFHYLPSTWWFHEAFAFPSKDSIPVLILQGILAVIFNAFFMLAVVLTSPLIASMACMLTIPLSGVVDWIIYDDFFSFPGLIGAMLVIIGFILIVD